MSDDMQRKISDEFLRSMSEAAGALAVNLHRQGEAFLGAAVGVRYDPSALEDALTQDERNAQ